MHNFEAQQALQQTLNQSNILTDKYIKKSGFFPLPVTKGCRHPEHQPPSHIHIPQGKGYRHVCPGCGNVVDIIPQQVTL